MVTPRLARVGLLAGVIACGGIQARAQLFERTDPQREIELGRQVAMAVERAVPLSRDAAMRNRVRRIGEALVQAMPEKAYPYEFKVLEVKEFNAFCLPGGFMYVYEGLLTTLQDDDAVAFVMAHEITHAAHRHWKRMVEKMQGPTLIAILAGTILGSADVAQITAALVEAQYSREQETDADQGGIQLSWAAGFDPAGAARAAEEMEKLEKDTQVPVYLRSHPPANDRLQSLREAARALASRARASLPLDPAVADRFTEQNIAGKLPVERTAPSAYLPLAVGNRWVYRVGASDAPETLANTYTVTVVARVPTSHGDVWRIRLVLPGGATVTQQWLTTLDAFWCRSAPERQNSPWTHVAGFGNVGGSVPAGWSYAKVDLMDTPCGTFQGVIRLHRGQGDELVEAWYAPGVGMVKRVSGQGKVVETLVHFRKAVTPSDEVVDADLAATAR